MIVSRVVLDTNCLISALIFKGVISAKLRSLWENTIITPVICPETQTELKEVMAYPKFSLSATMQQILLADFLDHAEYFPSIQPIEPIQDLIDPKDAIFIDLARKANTAFLVSGDKHILSMGDKLPELNIVSPAKFLTIIHI